MRSRFLSILVALLFVAPSAALADDAGGSVKVFVLAGQSNMEGKVQQILLDHQVFNPPTDKMFADWRDGEKFVVRDDVLIKFGNRKGPLTVGFGSPNRTGVEMQFGIDMGEHFKQPVLLIKTAWGGHSLYRNFRPPSAGLPDEAFLKSQLENAQKRVKNNNEKRNRNDPLPTMDDITEVYGSSYRNMMAEVKDVMANYETLFPSLKGKTLKLAGFVWHQGWNDQYNGQEVNYAANMKHFIHDIRKDLGAPNLPVVIGVMGQNGSQPAKGAMKVIQDAQLAMQDVAEFKGNVKAVRTDVLIDKAAEELYPRWRQNFEQWKKTGSDHKYHYLGSAIWHKRMGAAFAKAMLGLMGE